MHTYANVLKNTKKKKKLCQKKLSATWKKNRERRRAIVIESKSVLIVNNIVAGKILAMRVSHEVPCFDCKMSFSFYSGKLSIL